MRHARTLRARARARIRPELAEWTMPPLCGTPAVPQRYASSVVPAPLPAYVVGMDRARVRAL
ncbi:hypothetical protein [Streptomyces erythrochromogenes]|uniref:hypothetical protein n=1 Tax=Streptomyces erythrochromogenes TaxID=285574 RepID=UPI0036BE36E6